MLKKSFSSYYLLCPLIVLSLYVENAYFNIMEAKFKAFAVIFFINLIPAAVILAVHMIRRLRRGIPSPGLGDVSIGIFTAVTLISCLSSGAVYDSFWGADGWHIGAFTIIAMVFSYLFISRCHTYNHNMWIWLYTAAIVLFIIGILQFAGLDILGYSENLLAKQRYQYISTYGNTNWQAGFLCLMLPVAFIFFLSARGRTDYFINLAFLFFGISHLLLCASDGGYLGLGFCAFFALPYICRSMERIRRTLLVCIILFAQASVIALLPCYDKFCDYTRGLSGAVLDLRISIPMLLVCVLLTLWLSRVKADMPRLRKGILITCEVVLALAVAVMLADTVVNFNDKWGSSRGMIWRVSFENFADYPAIKKLIGIGPDILRDRYLEVQKQFKNLAVLSSHSEPIQILVTTGIAGLAAWLGVVADAGMGYIRAMRDPDTRDDARFNALFISMAAYFAQSFVNSATLLNLCLLTVIYALFTQQKRNLIYNNNI